jgi:hypothetical protein
MGHSGEDTEGGALNEISLKSTVRFRLVRLRFRLEPLHPAVTPPSEAMKSARGASRIACVTR